MYLEYYVGFEKDPSGSFSCIKVFRDNGDYSLECVSENNKRYWCTDPLFGATVHIAKESLVGSKVTEMIDKRESNEVIGDYLVRVVISRIEPSQLINLILEKEKAAFKAGQRDAQYNMRAALGIYN